MVNNFTKACIGILLFLSTAGGASAEDIRVAIGTGLRSVTVRAASSLSVDGVSRPAGQAMTFTAASVGKRPVTIFARGGIVQVNGHAYRGAIELRNRGKGRLLAVNVLELEDYLLGVVAAETPADWEMEALKAQAVASRTYALYQKQNTGRRAYHILATVDSQMYLGKRGERPRATRAVEETRGLVLSHRGDLVQAFYHASCGGHTENALELWGIDEPYLKGVDCDCQNISKYGEWEKRMTTAGMVRALKREGYRVGEIGSVEIGSLTQAGRVKSVVFRHRGGATTVPAETLRATIGYTALPSIFFEPEVVDREVVLSGRGLGHGVGLCQWGAKEMAQRGLDFRTILSRYYPGTAVVRRDAL